MSALKPCPFCGSHNVADRLYIRDGYRVACLDCGASTFAFNPDANDRAVDRWNRRSTPVSSSEADDEEVQK